MTSGVIGVPGTEPTMLFAGFDVFQGNLTLLGIIVAGVVGDVAGAVDRLRDRLLRPARAARVPRLQAPRERERPGPRPPLVRALRLARHLRLALHTRDPRGASPTPPASRGCRTRASSPWRRSGSIVWISGLARAGARGRRASGRPGATTWSTSTTSERWSWWLPSCYLIVRWRRSRGGPRRRTHSRSRRLMSSPTEADPGHGAGQPARCGRGGAAARRAARPGGAAADLLLRPHRARPVAARLGGVLRRRPRAAQGLRGGAPRRHGRGAAHHPARRGDRRRRTT